jgi:putative two-component system protein, hydrogenase maturation factor HypX/HoxX
MRILFLTHGFNSLTQRLYVELTALGHDISVEFDIIDSVTVEAVELFRPDLIVAPYLRRAIPEEVWSRIVCLVVHPGIKGDRGPSSLDWAIMDGVGEWGVTVLQAAAGMDEGDVWAHATFPMRRATKASLYRNEVTTAAATAVIEAVERVASGRFTPEVQTEGTWRPIMKQSNRAIDWSRDGTDAVLRKIRSADGFPGVLDTIAGRRCFLFDAHGEGELSGPPGEIIGRRNGAICRATTDGAVWITHLKERIEGERTFKQSATAVLSDALDGIPEVAEHDGVTWRDIFYEEENGVGYLHFPFYNGAMGSQECKRLEAAFREACTRDTRVIVLMGGAEFWSNGIHLNRIEAADSPADESWRNINAMDDLCEAILSAGSHFTMAAMQGNAGAGGVFLALAADWVVARSGIILNPHYKNMGNLYGSEYWTYLLPERVGAAGIDAVMGRRLPIGAARAREMGLIDECGPADPSEYRRWVTETAKSLAADASRRRRKRREPARPLAEYRAAELEKMRLNFYGFDPSYHVARHNFVHKVVQSRTPLFLAKHRRP